MSIPDLLIRPLTCDECGVQFQAGSFVGEDDNETYGYVCGTLCGGATVAVLRDDDLYRRLGVLHGSSNNSSRMTFELEKNVYSVPIVRTYVRPILRPGESFRSFRARREGAKIIYNCPCCSDGLARSNDELSSDEFVERGGVIVV